jgi:hypothetical protein
LIPVKKRELIDPMWARMPACAVRSSLSTLSTRSAQSAFSHPPKFLVTAPIGQSSRLGTSLLKSAFQQRFAGSSFMSVAVRAQAESANLASEGLKKQKMTKKIGTHNGTFHCDEALGVFLLERTDKFANGELVRTRDAKVRHIAEFRGW